MLQIDMKRTDYVANWETLPASNLKTWIDLLVKEYWKSSLQSVMLVADKRGKKRDG